MFGNDKINLIRTELDLLRVKLIRAGLKELFSLRLGLVLFKSGSYKEKKIEPDWKEAG
jgi:hypothetical protein